MINPPRHVESLHSLTVMDQPRLRLLSLELIDLPLYLLISKFTSTVLSNLLKPSCHFLPCQNLTRRPHSPHQHSRTAELLLHSPANPYIHSDCAQRRVPYLFVVTFLSPFLLLTFSSRSHWLLTFERNYVGQLGLTPSNTRKQSVSLPFATTIYLNIGVKANSILYLIL